MTLTPAPIRSRASRHGVTRELRRVFAFLRGRALLANLRVADLPAAIESLSAAIRQIPISPLRTSCSHGRVSRLRSRDSPSSRSENFQQALKAPSPCSTRRSRSSSIRKSGEAYVERGHLKEFSGEYSSLAAADAADLRKGLSSSRRTISAATRCSPLPSCSRASRAGVRRLEMIESAAWIHWPHNLTCSRRPTCSGDPGIKQAVQVLEGVLERDPLYVPAIVRLADVRWCGEGARTRIPFSCSNRRSSIRATKVAWRQLATI